MIKSPPPPPPDGKENRGLAGQCHAWNRLKIFRAFLVWDIVSTNQLSLTNISSNERQLQLCVTYKLHVSHRSVIHTIDPANDNSCYKSHHPRCQLIAPTHTRHKLALEPVLSWLLIYWLWPTRALATSVLCCIIIPFARSPEALVSLYSPQMLSPNHLSVSGQSITLVCWLSCVNSNIIQYRNSYFKLIRPTQSVYHFVC